MQQKTLGVTLLGHGTVGQGVSCILRRQHAQIRQRAGITFDMRHIIVRDPARHTDACDKLPLSTDALAAINDPATDLIVELMGGIEPASSLIRAALKLGKPVVTANKALLAEQGHELFALARRHNTVIAFEASCGGGIPIIGALLNGLAANQIHDLIGIVNGTCNFILTKMTQNGWSYAHALAEAQKSGFAEADPTADVSGRDAAQKLAILAGLAFDVHLREPDIHVEGIDQLDPLDIQFAGELGYVIKLLAIASRNQSENTSPNNTDDCTLTTDTGPIAARVHPTLVHKSDMLAEVSGSFNAISIYGHALGHAMFYGRGAGKMPTASAVVADMINIATGAALSNFNQCATLPDTAPPASIVPFDQLQSRYYLRLTARDEPGVMAQVTRVLADNGISLSAVLQHEANASHFVPVVITTHRAQEGAMHQALSQIDQLPIVSPPTICLRIIDTPKEYGV